MMARFMHPEIYKAVITGDTSFCRNEEPLVGFSHFLDQISPQGDTVLHVAASSGHDELVELILLKQDPTRLIISKKNSKNNLAIHVAAAKRRLSTVQSLVRYISERHDVEAGFTVESMLLEVNEDGDTALHVALKYRQKEIAEFLLNEAGLGQGANYKPNRDGKSPFYMVAEAGYVDLMKAMMDKVEDDLFNNRPQICKAKSAVNAAIKGKHIDILEFIVEKKPILIYLEDEDEMTALSYAIFVGYNEGVRLLLDKSPAALYQMDQQTGCFPIHIASSQGRVDIIQQILGMCPEALELLNKNGRNILHVAVENGKTSVVNYILRTNGFDELLNQTDNYGRNILHVAVENGKTSVVNYILRTNGFDELLNQTDNKGNTPLHLAAKYGPGDAVHALTWDRRVVPSLNLTNDDGLTALDIAEENMRSIAEENMRSESSMRERMKCLVLRSKGVPNAIRNVKITTRNLRETRKHEHDMVNTLLLVSTLVVTVTFAAGFTVPGGYNSSNPHEGMATLVTKLTFQLFCICNTIALFSSITAAVNLIWAQLGDAKLVDGALNTSGPLLGVALILMSVAFMTGVHVVVSSLNWLANVVLTMGSVFLFVLFSRALPLFPGYIQVMLRLPPPAVQCITRMYTGWGRKY